eukprot:gene4113-4803_t
MSGDRNLQPSADEYVQSDTDASEYSDGDDGAASTPKSYNSMRHDGSSQQQLPHHHAQIFPPVIKKQAPSSYGLLGLHHHRNGAARSERSSSSTNKTINPFTYDATPYHLTSNRRRWSHLWVSHNTYIFGRQTNAFLPNWKSLSEPASLPITTDYFPSSKDLLSKYSEYVHTLTLSPDENEYHNNTEALLKELISQRLAQGYQLIIADGPPSTSTPSGTKIGPASRSQVYRLSFGHDFHVVTYDPGNFSVQVKRYLRHSGRRTPNGIGYTYFLCTVYHTAFIPQQTTLSYQASGGTYPWNSLDNLICGTIAEIKTTLPGAPPPVGGTLLSSPNSPIPSHKATPYNKPNITSPTPMSSQEILATPTPTEVFAAGTEHTDEERIASFGKFKDYINSLIAKNSNPALASTRMEVKPITGAQLSAFESAVMELPSTTSSDPEYSVKEKLLPGNHQAIFNRINMAPPVGVKVVDRTYRLRKYRKCFVSSELIDWILQNVEVASRDEATNVCLEMVEHPLKFIKPVEKTQFVDGFHYYHLNVGTINESYEIPKGKESSTSPPTVESSPRHFDSGSSPLSNPSDSLRNSVGGGFMEQALHSSLGSSQTTIVNNNITERYENPNGCEEQKIEMDPSKTDRYEWIMMRYDKSFSPTRYYHVEFKWMVCTGCVVDDFIGSCIRKAKQFGLTFIQIPSEKNYSPFYAPIHIKLVSKLMQPEVIRVILAQFNFIPDLLRKRPASLVTRNDLYLFNDSDVVYTEYIHRTGMLFVRVVENGFLCIVNNAPSNRPFLPAALLCLKAFQELVNQLNSTMPSIIYHTPDSPTLLDDSFLVNGEGSPQTNLLRSLPPQEASFLSLFAQGYTSPAASEIPPPEIINDNPDQEEHISPTDTQHEESNTIESSQEILYYSLMSRDNLPDTITHLDLPYDFDEELGPESLPRHLVHLSLGGGYNQVLRPNVLPETLLSLDFGVEFDHPIAPGTFPESLEVIAFGVMFNQSIGLHNLPKSLKKLELGPGFDKPIHPGTLPDTLTHLWINGASIYPTQGSLPESLTYLDGVIWQLPSNLEHLTLDYDSPEHFRNQRSLKSVTFIYLSNPLYLSDLTSSVTKLDISCTSFNEPIIQGSLPPHLTHLSLGSEYNQPILPGLLPKSLTHLAVGKAYSKPFVAGSIPSSVTHFSCGDSFRQKLTRNLIPSVTHVTVSVGITLYNINNTGGLTVFLDNLHDFVSWLVQTKGMTVHCQGVSIGYNSYLDLRMIDSDSVLLSNAYYVGICPLSNLKAAIAYHSNIDFWYMALFFWVPQQWQLRALFYSVVAIVNSIQ